jgi:hypothetical protein
LSCNCGVFGLGSRHYVEGTGPREQGTGKAAAAFSCKHWNRNGGSDYSCSLFPVACSLHKTTAYLPTISIHFLPPIYKEICAKPRTCAIILKNVSQFEPK